MANANRLWFFLTVAFGTLMLSSPASAQWDDNPQAVHFRAGPFATPLSIPVDAEKGITEIEISGILNSDDSGTIRVDRRPVRFNDFGDGTMIGDPDPKEYVVTIRPVTPKANSRRRPDHLSSRTIYEIVFAEPFSEKRFFLNLMNDGVTPARLVQCSIDKPREPQSSWAIGPPVERVFRLVDLKTKGPAILDDEPVEPEISLSRKAVLLNGHMRPKIQIDGRLGGSAKFMIDKNTIDLTNYGEWGMQTQMGFNPSDVELVERKIDDPLKQGRRLFDVRGKMELTGGEHSCALVVGRSASAPHRLLIMSNSRVVQVIPLIDHQWQNFAAKRAQLTNVSAQNVVQKIRALHGNSFEFGIENGRVTSVMFRQQISEAALRLTSIFTSLTTLEIQSCAGLGESELKSIGLLKSVRRLSVMQTPVTDQLLETAGKLPNLKSLKIERVGTELAEITDAGIESLSDLQSLQNLWLSGRGITDRVVDSIAGHLSLKQLSLRQTSISPAGFFELHRSLPGCRISLSDYDNEKSETIISVTVEPGRIQIGEIPQEDDLRELADIKTITQVSLPSTSTDQSLEIISQLDALVSLTVNNGKITNDGIAHLVSLQDLKQLSLFHCVGIDDACLDHLAKMTSLRNLNLSQTRISKKGMQSLQDKLPNCKISR